VLTFEGESFVLTGDHLSPINVSKFTMHPNKEATIFLTDGANVPAIFVTWEPTSATKARDICRHSLCDL
jgi:hypothetical protein